MRISLGKILIVIIMLGFAIPVCVEAGGKKIHPTAMFDHDMHTNSFFVPMDVNCETCHINQEYQWKGMNKDGCHQCHGDKKKRIIEATNDCSMCHKLWPVKPPDHRANWERVHKYKGKAAKNECKHCHDDNFCISCHDQRKNIVLIYHKRNYRYFHSIDVRANPRKCDSCHQLAFCTQCHTNPRGK